MPERLSELEKTCVLYARLMEEIKRRHDVLRVLITTPHFLPEMAAFEFCYLQLRKICEVFALACLAAHGDIAEVKTRIVQNTYNADQIMKKLSCIHPQFTRYREHKNRHNQSTTDRSNVSYFRVSDQRGIIKAIWRMR